MNVSRGLCLYVCVCVYVGMYAYTHTYVHIYIHTDIHTPNARAGRKDKVRMYQLREAFSLPRLLHHSMSEPCAMDVLGDGPRGGERISLTP